MTITELALFILICYGMTLTFVYGSIFDKIRPRYSPINPTFFGKLFNCPMCLGFWVGIFVAIISPYTALFTFEGTLIEIILLGFISSGTSYALCVSFND